MLSFFAPLSQNLGVCIKDVPAIPKVNRITDHAEVYLTEGIPLAGNVRICQFMHS